MTSDPGDRPVVAFFDMDETILTVNSAARYARFLFGRGELPFSDVVRSLRWVALYRLALIDGPAVTRRVIATVAGEPETTMIRRCTEWYHQDIARFVSRAAERAVDSHRARGHHVVLLTAATPYIAKHVEGRLGLDATLATQLEVDDQGLFTGRPIEPLCYGEGKIHWASEYASGVGAALSDCHFYTDSYTDVPVLERVGHPIAVNPDPRLKRYAERLEIPIEYWR